MTKNKFSENNAKKSEQLGMNHSTASHRLVKDILWSLLVSSNQHACYKCGSTMDRSNFSIEHKVPWLDSEDPRGLYFDLKNVSFSHLKCNIGSRRSYDPKHPCGTLRSYKNGCHCVSCTAANAESNRKRYTPESRRARYEQTGH